MVYALIQRSHDDDVALTGHTKIKDEEFSVNKNFDIASKKIKRRRKKKKTYREKLYMIQTYNWYIIEYCNRRKSSVGMNVPDST